MSLHNFNYCSVRFECPALPRDSSPIPEQGAYSSVLFALQYCRCETSGADEQRVQRQHCRRKFIWRTLKSSSCAPELCLYCQVSVIESCFYSRVISFFGDVLHGELGAGNAEHRSQDEWEHRRVWSGALPLRSLLCHMRNRHRNGTGTRRISR